jgi:hypothetical protein
MKPLSNRQLSFILTMVLAALSLPLVARATLAAPIITANPNPVVVPEGKTEGTSTISWDAGADRSDSRVWLQVDNGKEDIFAASAKGTSEIKVVMGKTYTFRLYSGDGGQVLASIVIKAQRPKPVLPAIPRSAPGAHPAYIYGVLPDGTLRWHRHDGGGRGTVEWQGPRDITTGLQGLRQVFAGSDPYNPSGVFYTVAANGDLKRYPHSLSYTAGDFDTEGTHVPRNVGNGWQNFKHVFSAGASTFYAVAQDGSLKWHRYQEKIVDEAGKGPWEGPKDVGSGWGSFKNVFSTGEGIIYAITPEGRLLWYKHNFYRYGVGSGGQGKDGQAAWEGPMEVGTGWQNFKHVFSAGDGVIYAVTKEGKLLWYKHQGYLTGAKIWLGPREVASSGWENFEHVFALLSAYPIDYSRSSKPDGVKRVPPVFSTPTESSPFFRELIVQPGSNTAIISFTPLDDSLMAIAVSTGRPLSLPYTVPYNKSTTNMVERTGFFAPGANVSLYCVEPWPGVFDKFRNPHKDRRDCRLNGLAPNTTYNFVISAYIYVYVTVPEGPGDSWLKPVSVLYYSGSFKTKSPDTLRPRKL